ncbi:TetR family transcriptional regulator [Amycolatopsis ultiminotia]|uniref:TetR family transcriptional regulator n=1 Tax=Amycolatopsis ultiminotia TaxID=543629 RepID=A0ABP6WXS9_9PSEU
MSSEEKPRRLRADAERNRTRLLEAGRAAFGSGREPVTLEQVARDAGVGIGTLYRHFPTREALVEALYRDEVAQLCASAEVLLAAEGPARALRRWMDRFADYATTKREMADSLRMLFSTGAVAISEVRKEFTAAVQTILDAGTVDGTLRTDVRAEDVVVSVVGMASATAINGGQEQLNRMFDLLMDGIRR